MFVSREDFARRSAAQLLESPDEHLRNIGAEVFVRLTPRSTRRETYGPGEVVLAAAAVFVQLADLAYAIWTNRHSRDERGEIAGQLRVAMATMEAQAENGRINSQLTEQLIDAILRTVPLDPGKAPAEEIDEDPGNP